MMAIRSRDSKPRCKRRRGLRRPRLVVRVWRLGRDETMIGIVNLDADGCPLCAGRR